MEVFWLSGTQERGKGLDFVFLIEKIKEWFVLCSVWSMDMDKDGE